MFPALACSSRWPAVSLKVGQASVLPSVHILHRGETYRYAAAPVSPCFYFVLLPRLLYIPFYIPLLLHSLSLAASLPDGAARCSTTGLTGDNKPVCAFHGPPCDKSNSRLLLPDAASVHHRGAALLYLIMGKRHRAFPEMLSLVSFD